jgi:predicted DNA-binding transcriptional regulator AlpA
LSSNSSKLVGIDKLEPICYHVGMSFLTIQETMKATGVSRPTILAYLESGKLAGRKTGANTQPWLVSAESAESLRLERIAELEAKIAVISAPVAVAVT